jgi:hypothetical protein
MFILFWILCGIGAAGILVASFDKDNDSFRQELGSGLLMGVLFGPVALVVCFFWSGFCQYGWRLWPKKEQS